MLIIVAMSTVACGEDTSTEGPTITSSNADAAGQLDGAAVGDGSAAGDGSVAGDGGEADAGTTNADATTIPQDTAVAADTAAPEDTATPADTAAPNDTASSADTAAPNDTNEVGDTAAPQDAASTDDTTQTPDAGAPPCVDDKGCYDGNPCTVNTCDKALGCTTKAMQDGVKCDDGGSNKCVIGGVCKGDGAGSSTCDGGKQIACDDDNPCTADTCNPATGLCEFSSNTAACDDGDACTANDACKNGTCSGVAKSCDDKNGCTTDSCNSKSGDCAHANNTGACDDNNACTANDACAAGKCAGGPKTCDDGDVCTTDSCDEKAGCQTKIAIGAPCADDAKCLKGTCGKGADGKVTCAVGVIKGCDDNNACTIDTCTADKGCQYDPAKDGTKCGDGDKCVDAAVCGKGSCQPGKKLDCADSNPCTDDACDPKIGCSWSANTAACDDGNKCTAGSACSNGQCAAGKPVDAEAVCGDKNPCTAATCDPTKGCTNVAKVVTVKCDGTVAEGSCYKAIKQTGNWTAAEKGCVAWGGHLVSIASAQENTRVRQLANSGCGNGWTTFIGLTDAAKEGVWVWTDGTAYTYKNWATNQPSNSGNNEDFVALDNTGTWNDVNTQNTGCYVCEKPVTTAPPCDDGSACTKGETCAGGKCQGGTTNGCDDGKPCTKDACDPKTGGCSWSSLSGTCDDGNKCTGDGVCKTGTCQVGAAKSCDDKNTCTIDSCDAKTGACVNNGAGNAGKACDDGSKCTSDTKCTTAGKCAGKVVVCDDANACTLNNCDPGTGKCTFSANNGATCDVGPCTTGDACKNGQCLAGPGKGCDDGNSCTLDTCDGKTGKCAFNNGNENGACEDGKACTTGDTCKAGTCTPSKDNCTIASTNFDCTSQNTNKGWTLEGSNTGSVRWRFDNSPGVSGMSCTLNFNDDNDYSPNQNYEAATNPSTHRRARSPYYDVTKVKGSVEVSFDFYRDMDLTSDRVLLYVYRNTDTNWASPRDVIELPRTGCDGPGTTCMKKIFKGYKVYPKGVAGSTFRFYVTVTGSGSGKGFYMDNVKIRQGPETPEVCNDGKDNDGDGATDCKDTECTGTSACIEACGDGKDNDGDDQVDCDDSDCSNDLACVKPIWSQSFDCTKAHGWSLVNRTGWSTKWAVDQTPTVAALQSYGCTMNLNNGKNYCQNQTQQGSQIRCAGLTAPYNGSSWYMSALSPWIDGTKINKNVVLRFDTYLDIDTADSARVRVYVEGSNDYVHEFYIPETGCNGTCIKKLQKDVAFTLTAVKQKKFRLRFAYVGQASGTTEFYNQGAGFFFDNVRVYAP